VTGELKWRTGTVEDYTTQKWNRFSNLEVKVNLDGRISDKASGHVTIWRPDYTYDWDQRGTHVDTAYIEVQDGLVNGLDWRLGKQYYKTGLGLVFDNDAFPAEAVKLGYTVGGVDLAAFWGTTDFSDVFWGSDPEDALFVANAKYAFGKLGLEGTYVGKAGMGNRRWGVAATYPGINVPLLGITADFAGEYALSKELFGSSTPGDKSDAWYTSLNFHGKGYQPGDWLLHVSYAETQPLYMPVLNTSHSYNSYVIYGGHPWDYCLTLDPTIGLPGGLTYNAALIKSFGKCDLTLAWTQLNPWRGTSMWLWSGWSLPDTANLYAVKVGTELTEGVKLDLIYGTANGPMANDTRDYWAGAIDVTF